MYKKILMAVDGTETARHALDQTLILARSEEAELILASVVPAYDGDLRIMGDKSALDAMRAPFEKALSQAKDRAAQMGIKAGTMLLEGDPVEQLLILAEEQRVDCIALGKRGNYYSDLIPIGTVASKVARLAETDVLLVPNHKELRLERIIAPVDGSEPSIQAAGIASGLASRYGSRLYLPTVYEVPIEGFVHNPDMDQQFNEKARRFLAPLAEAAEQAGARDVKAEVVQGVPAYKVLLEIIRQEDFGLVVMGSSGRGRFQHLLLGSVAERIIGSGAAPVLLVK